MNKKMTKKTPLIKKTLISVVASSVLLTNVKAVDPNELPSGSQIVHGNVNISKSNNTMNVNQSSSKAIVNWNKFNVGSNATVNFNQPSSNSVILNRVISSNPSTINGSINANGQVFLINPNGILFGQNSRVNVGGLVASTMDITNENFLNGNYSFFGNDKNAVIKNYGQLSAKLNGYIALLAPEVINEGVILANKGSIAIGGGNKAKLNFDGLNIVSLEVENDTLDTLIKNKHLVSAPDGTIIMSVDAANALHAAVINNEGVIEANNLTSKDGKILLTATGENSTITNSGIISSSSTTTDGGEVRITADKDVTLTNTSNILAEGVNGGFLAIASKDNLILDGTYSVKSNASKENGWLYTGNNVFAARFMRNPNADGAGVKAENTTVIFEENQGQTDSSIDFLTRADNATMYLSAAEAYVAMQENLSTMILKDANDNAEAIGEDLLQSYSNYYIGNDESQWYEGVKHYGAVRYKSIYDEIDLVYYGNKNGDIEYDLVVNANADISKIAFDYNNADSISLNELGDIVVKNGNEVFIQKAPLTYQKEENAKRIIPSSYELENKEVKIKTDTYDNSKELVIDPVIEWSSYLGGSGVDSGKGIAIDENENIYITGQTNSTNFNTTNGFQTTYGGSDAFISKFASDGSLLWSSYLGGSDVDSGEGIAIGNNGNTYITGGTKSTNFNTTNGFQSILGGNYDAFISKLSPDGSLLWSSYLGGSSGEYGWEIAVDNNNNAYVTGYTQSTDFNSLDGFQTTFGGGTSDAFITKVSSNGSLLWSSYLGGNSLEHGWGIDIDDNGDLYIAGSTRSTNFNTINGFQTTFGGEWSDAFITKVSSNGSLIWSSYLGGSGRESIDDIKVDNNGNIYVTGGTTSTNFNTTNGFQTTYGGGHWDSFITQFSPNGSILWSSYLGTSGGEHAYGIAIDKNNNFYITGYIDSTDFYTKNAFQSSHSGGSDAFITKFSSNHSLLWSSYLGGGNDLEYTYDIAADNNGHIYLTGFTESTNFNITTNAFQTILGGFEDAFVIKVDHNTAPSSTGSSTGNFNEEDNGISIYPNFSITDTDSGDRIGGAIITIYSGLEANIDELLFTNQNGISGSYDNSTGILTLTGEATKSNYETAIKSIKFKNNSDDPSTTQRSISIIVNDTEEDSQAISSQITVNSINDAPVLNTGAYNGYGSSGGIKEFSTNHTENNGYSINQLIQHAGNNFIQDVDSSNLGIAVTSIDNTGGTWQYTLNGGTTWSDIPNVSDSSALLLSNSSTTQVRFVPDNIGDETLSRAIAFFAWDTSTGANGDTNVNVNTRGNATAYSTDWARAYYSVVGPVSTTIEDPETIIPDDNIHNNPIRENPKDSKPDNETQEPENPNYIGDIFTSDKPSKAIEEYLTTKGISASVGVAVSGLSTTLLNLQSTNTLKKFFDERYIATIRQALGETLGKPKTIAKLKEISLSAGTDILKGAALSTLIDVFITDTLKAELTNALEANGINNPYANVMKDYAIDVTTMFVKNAYLSKGNALVFQAGFTMDMAAFSTSKVIEAYNKKQELDKEINNMYFSFYSLASQANILQDYGSDTKIVNNLYNAIESNYLDYYYSGRSSTVDKRVPSSNEIKRIAQISVEIDNLYPNQPIMESPQSAEQRAEKLKELIIEVDEMEFGNNHDRLILLERLVEGSGSNIDIAKIYRNL